MSGRRQTVDQLNEGMAAICEELQTMNPNWKLAEAGAGINDFLYHEIRLETPFFFYVVHCRHYNRYLQIEVETKTEDYWDKKIVVKRTNPIKKFRSYPAKDGKERTRALAINSCVKNANITNADILKTQHDRYNSNLDKQLLVADISQHFDKDALNINTNGEGITADIYDNLQLYFKDKTVDVDMVDKKNTIGTKRFNTYREKVEFQNAAVVDVEKQVKLQAAANEDLLMFAAAGFRVKRLHITCTGVESCEKIRLEADTNLFKIKEFIELFKKSNLGRKIISKFTVSQMKRR